MAVAAVLASRAGNIEDEEDPPVAAESSEVRARLQEYAENPSEELARQLGYEWPQLNRKTFADRMSLEAVMVDNTIQFLLYLLLVILYLLTVCRVDPIGSSSSIGQELKNHFDADKLEGKRTIDDVMEYTQTFFDKAFELSPAMVDVHTLNSLDVKRCFDERVDDICSATNFWRATLSGQDLMYWGFDNLGPQQQSSIITPACKLDMCGDTPCGYKGLQPMPFHFLWGNVTMKEMDYTLQSSRGSSCMYRESHTILYDNFRDSGNGSWLTPEKPLVLQRKKPYTRPYMVVTTPIVMQQRGMLKPCRGLGGQYVNELVGYCQDPNNCDPSKVTSINNAYQHPFSHRSYTAWVSYNDPVVQCVDYEDEDPDFKDQSFNAWSNYETLTNGWSQTGKLREEDVFWRFASDVRHLQKPLKPQKVCPSILQGLNSSDPQFTLPNSDEYGIERPVLTDPKVCEKCISDVACAGYFYKRYAAEMLRWSPMATGRQMLSLASQVDRDGLADIYNKLLGDQQDRVAFCHVLALIAEGIEDTLLRDYVHIISARCDEWRGMVDWTTAPATTKSVQEQEAPAVVCTDMIWLDPDMGCPKHVSSSCRSMGSVDPNCCFYWDLAGCANGFVKRRDNSRKSPCNMGTSGEAMIPFCCIPEALLDDVQTFPCDSGLCIPSFNRCNGIVNCDDGSDERECNTTNKQTTLAAPGPGQTTMAAFGSLQSTQLPLASPQTTLPALGNASNSSPSQLAPTFDPTASSPNFFAQLFSPAIFMSERRIFSWWANRQLPSPMLRQFKLLREQIIRRVAQNLNSSSAGQSVVTAYIEDQVKSLDPMGDREHELWCIGSQNCLMHQACLSNASRMAGKLTAWLGSFVHDQDRLSRLLDLMREKDNEKCEAKLFYITENLMLSDTPFKPYASVRRLWEKSFMDLKKDERRNTFVTKATSKYMLALVVVTPQAEGLPEIITTVQVSFEFGQYGGIDTQFSLVSATGQLRDGWLSLMIFTVVVAAMYLLVNIGLSVYRSYERWATGEGMNVGGVGGSVLPFANYHREIVDTLIPVAMVIQLIILWRVSDEDSSVQLANAFKTTAGREKALFTFYADLVQKNFWINVVKMWGIIIAYAMFVRLVAYMAMHPRIALLVNTLLEIADDLLHFAISFLLIYFMMGVMAFWMFGHKRPAFASPKKASYMQFRMVTGDFGFMAEEDDPGPLFLIYCFTFILLIFFILLNFFLAIVVDGFMIAKVAVKDNESITNFFFDLVLVTIRFVNTQRGLYPSARALRRYAQDKLEEKLNLATKSEIQLQVLGESRSPNAVTAHELYDAVRDRENQCLFRSPDDARNFLLGYVTRFPHFIEKDLELCWKQGQHMEGLKPSHVGESRLTPREHSLMGAIQLIKDSPRKKVARSSHDVLAEEHEDGNRNEAVEGLPLIKKKIKKLGTGELTRLIMAATHRIANIQAVGADFDWADPGRASPVRM